MIQLRPIQKQKSEELVKVLNRFKIAYLSGETRSGKSLTVLNTADLFGAKDVLFITKKKAISSIESDYKLAQFTYKLTTINYESIHKIDRNNFDLVICDESHSLASYPKPSKRTKLIKKKFSHSPMILCTGTPAVESYSQWYHQFWISKHSPFEETNFYKWAKKYVNVFQKQFGTHRVNDYSRAKEEMISKVIEPYIVRMTRVEAGLEESVNEHTVMVETPKEIKKLADLVIEKRIVKGKTGYIEADTPASLASKCHQIYSGSVIIEQDNERKQVLLNDFKAKAIQRYFKDKKIAIMYFFRAEWDLIRQVYGDEVTDCLDEFKTTDKSIALQVTTTEGVNLSEAEAIAFLNIGFSGAKHLQAIQRLTFKGRKESDIYYFLEKGGITEKVLKVVQSKADYNSAMFQKDFVK